MKENHLFPTLPLVYPLASHHPQMPPTFPCSLHGDYDDGIDPFSLYKERKHGSNGDLVYF